MSANSDDLESIFDQALPPSRLLSEFPSSPTNLLLSIPSASKVERHRRWNQSRMLNHTLDRVNVLGDNELHGHTGCVNALSWAEDGNLLISAGDDTTVRLWRMDTTNIAQEYPYVCTSVINTGHRANIFNARMLPHSSRIVTAAGDTEIRVFDVSTSWATATSDNAETQYSSQQTCTDIIRCHRDSVKKIVTEDSPDIFLSVSEDGTVRQHDLRTPHNCRAKACSAPLVDIGHELSTLSMSSLTPHQFIVAGESPFGYLFDRRHLRSTIEAAWGQVPNAGQGATTCVRKFGRPPEPPNKRREHITGSQMSQSNGHELILTYRGDGVYLYSTKDDVASKDDLTSPSASALLSNANKDKADSDNKAESENSSGSRSPTQGVVSGILDEISFVRMPNEYEPDVPIILPRSRYTGARNVATIKDVNFLGPEDQWIVSGSDDGNFFIWDKKDAKIHGIYEGDSSVVNVVEGHPHFPLLAVSGIDTTVKLFTPTFSNSAFSRMANATQIIEQNQRMGSTMVMGANLAALQILAEIRNAVSNQEARPLECTPQ